MAFKIIEAHTHLGPSIERMVRSIPNRSICSKRALAE